MTWTKLTLNKEVDWDELGRIFDHIYPQYVSAGARLGFLLKLAQMETATKTPAVKFATRLGKLLSRTRVTCNWRFRTQNSVIETRHWCFKDFTIEAPDIVFVPEVDWIFERFGLRASKKSLWGIPARIGF